MSIILYNCTSGFITIIFYSDVGVIADQYIKAQHSVTYVTLENRFGVDSLLY